MAKYKNKNGIELNITANDSASVLIREVVSEAVNICEQSNWHDETSMRWALQRVKDFLTENFDLEYGKEKKKEE